jgi:hypothetical protein
MHSLVGRGAGLACAAGVLLLSTTSPALAAAPIVESFPLSEDPLSFSCGGRDVVLTSGTLLVRTRELADGGTFDIRKPVDAVGRDQFGTTYRLHATASFRGDEDAGTFRLNGALKPSGGKAEVIHLRFSYEGETVTVQDTGTCSVNLG